MTVFNNSSILSTSLLAFFSLFSVINPIKFVIVFLSMTYFCSKERRKQLANKSMFVSLLTLLICMFVGEYVFDFLQIQMYAFKIGGGVLLAISGVHMILGQDIELPNSDQVQEVNDDIAIFPLAIPIITGPGAISTGIVIFSDAHSLLLKTVIILAVLANFIIMFIFLQLSYTFAKKLSTVVLNILYRSCGLLLSALAINIFIKGIIESGLFS